MTTVMDALLLWILKRVSELQFIRYNGTICLYTVGESMRVEQMEVSHRSVNCLVVQFINYYVKLSSSVPKANQRH